MPEQVVINSIEFARNGESLHGRVAVEKLERLRDSVFSSQGVLDYVLTGRRDENGRLYLGCVVTGELQLECQRCLEAMSYPVNVESVLELVEDESVQLDEESLVDVIKANPRFDVLGLVEDEVLLALPMAPMHESQDCKMKSGAAQADSGKQNAFSALAALKTQKLRN